jgi:imidazole glycerol phosphate synthase glutamine amidotransferase subunit
MRIEIIDLGLNNLTSVERALLKKVGKSDSCKSISKPNQSDSPDLLILPGLGHFASGMERLRESGLDKLLVLENSTQTPIVGICLGMQLFCDESEEAPGVPGLGMVPGVVKKLPDGEPSPNIGWGELESTNLAGDFPSLKSERDFYFVHSFHVDINDSTNVMTTTRFAESRFVSSYKSENVLGFQFHPEKSGEIGQILIEEILEWAR